jgi:hypothetical protein
MMWSLEHVADPPAVLRQARRVLVRGGVVTAIEVNYSTCRAEPSTPSIEALISAMVEGMAASGWSYAGTRLPEWLREAGFRNVDEGERPYWWQDDDLAVQARYAADVMERSGRTRPATWYRRRELRAGLADLRGLVGRPGAGLGWVVHKSTAVR